MKKVNDFVIKYTKEFGNFETIVIFKVCIPNFIMLVLLSFNFN